MELRQLVLFRISALEKKIDELVSKGLHRNAEWSLATLDINLELLEILDKKLQ